MATGYTRISYEFLRHFLWLPESTEIVGIRANDTLDTFDVLLDDPRIGKEERVDLKITFLNNTDNVWSWDYEWRK